VRTKLIALTAVVGVVALAACGGSGGGSSSTPSSGTGGGTTTAEPVTLTLWHNYGDNGSGVVTNALAKAYMAANPNVTIKVVSQPADNYFALLQAAAISKSGPDLAVMWSGLFTLKYKSYLQNLKGLVPDDALAKVGGTEWTSDGFDKANGPYVMPFQTQFYIGFYNKDAFAKAGVASVPTTWDELYAACGKLKTAGYTPIVYGNGGQALGAVFYPWEDASYLMAGQFTVPQWKDLYNGAIKWTSPEVSAQFQKWADLYPKGCTNKDVLTKTNNIDDFTSGKAAMIVDGTWDSQKFTDTMADKVAPFVPPFSTTPIKGVVQFPGDGFAMTNYSQHQAAAAAFLGWLASDAAVKVVNDGGEIPAVTGSATTNPLNQAMLDFAGTQGYTMYPMLDNVIQGDVIDAGSKVLPSVLGGKTSVADGLGQLQNAWDQLPAENRGTEYR
jgi:raffinose/stachyose/melibiose transport system substrate-binding protein